MSTVSRLLEKTTYGCYLEGRLEAGNNIVQCSPFTDLGPFKEMICASGFLARDSLSMGNRHICLRKFEVEALQCFKQL